MDTEEIKHRLGTRAVDSLVESGMKLGLGTGSTAIHAVYRVGELEVYRVRSGDTYWTLCREKFGVPMWLLKHYNMAADLAALQIHQKLMMPLIEKTDAGDPGAVTSDEAAES